MTPSECREAVKQMFAALYPGCVVDYSYPSDNTPPTLPYMVLDFGRIETQPPAQTVKDGILYYSWRKSMSFTVELVTKSKTTHKDGKKLTGLSTVVDDLDQSIQFLHSAYAGDLMRALNIAVAKNGTPEPIYNSVSSVERARCAFYVDFIQKTKEYAALQPQDGEYIADHDSAASKELADMEAGWFNEIEIEREITE